MAQVPVVFSYSWLHVQPEQIWLLQGPGLLHVFAGGSVLLCYSHSVFLKTSWAMSISPSALAGALTLQSCEWDHEARRLRTGGTALFLAFDSPIFLPRTHCSAHLQGRLRPPRQHQVRSDDFVAGLSDPSVSGSGSVGGHKASFSNTLWLQAWVASPD